MKEFSPKGEAKVSPENILGSGFKHLEIVGQGSGAGFEFKNLNLPTNWVKSLKTLEQQDPSKLSAFYSSICEQNGCSLENIKFDPQRIIQEMSIKNKGSNRISTIAFSKLFNERREGVYEVENLFDTNSAFVIQSIMAKHLNFFNSQHSYIEGTIGHGFSPRGLEIPRKYFENKRPFISDYYRECFVNQAYNIAGRFGLDIHQIDIDENGLLKSCYVEGRFAPGYRLENGGGLNCRTYCGHNIDNLDQAFTLQTIVASYLNNLI